MDRRDPGRVAVVGHNQGATADLPGQVRNPDAGVVAVVGHSRDAAADLPGQVRNPDAEVVAVVGHSRDAAADPAVHRNLDGKDDGTRGISFPWDHNIP
mgnify:FL=1